MSCVGRLGRRAAGRNDRDNPGTENGFDGNRAFDSLPPPTPHTPCPSSSPQRAFQRAPDVIAERNEEDLIDQFVAGKDA